MFLSSDEFDAAEEHLRLGVEFFLTDELDVAIDEFREAAHQNADYAEAYHNLGVALAKTGDLTGAIATWTEVERLDPRGVSLRISLPALDPARMARFGDPEGTGLMRVAAEYNAHLRETGPDLGPGFDVPLQPAIVGYWIVEPGVQE